MTTEEFNRQPLTRPAATLSPSDQERICRNKVSCFERPNRPRRVRGPGLQVVGPVPSPGERREGRFTGSLHDWLIAHWGQEPSSGAPTFLSARVSSEVLADKNVGAPTARFRGSSVVQGVRRIQPILPAKWFYLPPYPDNQP